MPDRDPYTFPLPPALVAQDPPPERTASRLLIARRGGEVLGITSFAEVVTLLRSDDLLVVNDSRVLPARLRCRRTDTGGRVELLLVRPHGPAPARWEAMARPARRLKVGQDLELHDEQGQAASVHVTVTGRLDTGEVVVAAPDDGDLVALAEAHGSVPLPPYIKRDPEHPDAVRRRRRDRGRYQTVNARLDRDGTGSVAAPTAGLHFDPPLLARLADRGVGLARVTLHVGPGTFQPPSEAQIREGRLHPEAFELPDQTWASVARCRRRGGRVVAVGTTSLRVLATVAGLGLPDPAVAGTERSFDGDPDPRPVFAGRAVGTAEGWRVRGTTRLFLQPPDRITAADALITNFHLPGSSLLRLVAAFGGDRLWREAYRQAIEAGLRFFSYGDAMILLPEEAVP
ncbi:MAG: S-adenosylmethionine:tRNA ribosyltransferase-isomerase [Candidatus Krumholzibacteriia bacterium]